MQWCSGQLSVEVEGKGRKCLCSAGPGYTQEMLGCGTELFSVNPREKPQWRSELLMLHGELGGAPRHEATIAAKKCGSACESGSRCIDCIVGWLTCPVEDVFASSI